jgi:hypothetical protein
MKNYELPNLTVYNQAKALMRFLMGAGGRVAQRVFIPLICSFMIVYLVLGPDFFNAFTAALLKGGYFLSAIPTTFFALTVALLAAPRVGNGLTGWMRHLPMLANTSRRIAGIVLLITILPILIIFALLSLAAANHYHLNVTPYLLGLPLVGMAAALFGLPVKRRHLSRPLLVMACLSFSSLDWYLLFTGMVMLISADIISGPILQTRRRKAFSPTRSFHFIANWRAVRLRLIIPYLLSFIVYLFLFLFISNNPYDYHQTNMAIRLAVGMSLIIFCASLSHILALRRPPWSWSRSLPWSARQRICKDAQFMMFHLVPLVVVSAVIRWQLIPFILCVLPPLVLYSTKAIYRISSGRVCVLGNIFLTGMLATFLFGLFPYVSLVFLAMTPWLIKQAAAEDKYLPVSQWEEVSHIAEGDSQSWSGR